ncbi:MAG: hypothetical protein H6727_17610 [Myxococcales bacterium]|nr:hypothetical protein [Myxococcales bacterium]
MTIQEEHKALLRAGLLPEGAEPELMLWGVISGGRLEGREGILFLAGGLWGFYGRDFVYLTSYAGFVGDLARLSGCEGPMVSGDSMESYALEGLVEGEGPTEQRYFFTPDAMTYRRRLEEIPHFFMTLRQRVNNQLLPEASGLFRQGLAHWEAGHLSDAEDLLRAAGRIDPRSALPPFFVGQLILEQGERGREALQQLQVAQQRLYEDNQALYLALGRAHLQEGDLRSAERAFLESLQYHEDAQAHFFLAEVYGEQKRLRDRAHHLKQAVVLEPEGPYLAWLALDAARERDWGHTRLHLAKLHKEHKDNPIALAAQAYLSEQEGRQHEAIQLVKQALAVEPDLEVLQDAKQHFGLEHEPSSEGDEIFEPPPHSPTRQQHNAAEAFMWLHEQEEQLSRQQIPLMIEEFSSQIATFSDQWGAYLMTCMLRGDSLDQAMEALQVRLREGMTEQARGFLLRARGWLHEQWYALHEEVLRDLPFQSVVVLEEDAEDPIAMTGRVTHQQLFLRLLEHTEIRLEALFSQLLQYALGLVDGGLVTLFLLDLQGLSEHPDPNALSGLLQKRLQPIVQRLNIYLKAWLQQYLDLLQVCMGRLLDLSIGPVADEDSYLPSAMGAGASLSETSALHMPLSSAETTALQIPSPEDPSDEDVSFSSGFGSLDDSFISKTPMYRAEKIDAVAPASSASVISPPPTSASPSRSSSKSAISVSSSPGGGLFFLPKLPGEEKGSGAVSASHRPSAGGLRSAPTSSPALSGTKPSPSPSGAAKAYRVSAISPSGSAPLFQSPSSSPNMRDVRPITGGFSPLPEDEGEPTLHPAAAASLRNEETTALDTGRLRSQISGDETPPTSFPAVPQEDEPLPDPQSDPIGWAYAMYHRAFQSLGYPEPPTSKDRFVRILETKVQAWKQRTGQDPDIYVEIEQGRPQIKLRER